MAKKKNIETESFDKFLERQYGSGIIQTANQIIDKKRDILKTVLSLDIALGGGLPEGVTVLISGKAKAGKCLGTRSSFIITDKGILSLDELKNLSKEVVTHKGNNKKINYWYDNGIAHTFNIKTSFGIKINITDDHPLMILNDCGQLEWKKGIELKIGDVLAGRRGDRVWGTKNIETNDAYVYGLLIGDGNIIPSSVRLSNIDKECINAFKKFGKKHNIKIKTYNAKDHHLNSSVVALPIYKMEWYIGKQKQIPSELRQVNEKTICTILRGYFDADGGIEQSKYISATTSSHILATQIQSILLNLGILSNVRQVKKRAKTLNGYSPYGIYYIISIHNVSDLILFNKYIGFGIKRKQLLLNKICKRLSRTKKDTIPNIHILLQKFKDKIVTKGDNKGFGRTTMWLGANAWIRRVGLVGRNTLRRFLDFYKQYEETKEYKDLYDIASKNLFFDKIKEIQEGEEHTSDINIEQDNSFISNGLISHNTSLCLQILKNAIDEKRPAFYFDIERRCSHSLIGTVNGLDTSRLQIIKSTPEKILSCEDWLQILEQVIKNNPKGVIIVDSLAMLSTMAEQSELLGQSRDMAGVPKLMASFFRRIQQTVDDNSVILIFISQLQTNRDPNGKKYSEKGGFSIQYSNSVWINTNWVTRWQKDVEKNAPLGHDIQVEIQCSALGPPFLPCSIPLRYGQGIDTARDIIQNAENVGLIEKSGAWYSIPTILDDKKEPLKFQGLENLREFLNNNLNELSKLDICIRDMLLPGIKTSG